MIHKMIEAELENLGFIKKRNDLIIYDTYISYVNDVVQILRFEELTNPDRIRIFFDIVPIYTDKYYLGRMWEYELKKMNNNLSVLNMEYKILNNPDYYKEVICDIRKFIKPIFEVFNKTDKLLSMLIVLDQRIYKCDIYADFRKLAIALKCHNYEYAMLILLHLKYDRAIWNFRTDLQQFIEFENINLKKYTKFSYEEDEYIKYIDKLIYTINKGNYKEIEAYLNQNKQSMLVYFEFV